MDCGSHATAIFHFILTGIDFLAHLWDEIGKSSFPATGSLTEETGGECFTQVRIVLSLIHSWITRGRFLLRIILIMGAGRLYLRGASLKFTLRLGIKEAGRSWGPNALTGIR